MENRHTNTTSSNASVKPIGRNPSLRATRSPSKQHTTQSTGTSTSTRRRREFAVMPTSLLFFPRIAFPLPRLNYTRNMPTPPNKWNLNKNLTNILDHQRTRLSSSVSRSYLPTRSKSRLQWQRSWPACEQDTRPIRRTCRRALIAGSRSSTEVKQSGGCHVFCKGRSVQKLC